jgi:hypothetical protein
MRKSTEATWKKMKDKYKTDNLDAIWGPETTRYELWSNRMNCWVWNPFLFLFPFRCETGRPSNQLHLYYFCSVPTHLGLVWAQTAVIINLLGKTQAHGLFTSPGKNGQKTEALLVTREEVCQLRENLLHQANVSLNLIVRWDSICVVVINCLIFNVIGLHSCNVNLKDFLLDMNVWIEILYIFK